MFGRPHVWRLVSLSLAICHLHSNLVPGSRGAPSDCQSLRLTIFAFGIVRTGLLAAPALANCGRTRSTRGCGGGGLALRPGRAPEPEGPAQCSDFDHAGSWLVLPCRRASHVRSVGADPANEPKHYQDDQNNSQDAAKPRSPVATVRIVPAAAAENHNQQNDDKNNAHKCYPSTASKFRTR